MATTTTKLGLKKPVASDYFNIDDANGNMDKIDALTHIVKSGATAANIYAINSMTNVLQAITWRWKKYDDGTFEAWVYFTSSSLRCNDGAGETGTYRSGYVRLDYPNIGITNIYNLQLTLRCGPRDNWVIESSSAENLQYSVIQCVGMVNEGNSESIPKRIYVQIHGTWK